MKKLSAILFSFALAFAFPVGAFAKGADKNCSDFKTQQEAQQYFVSHGGSKYNNVDNLDHDHDGIACESLPSGSSSGSTKHSGSHHSTSGSHTSTTHHSTSGSHNAQPPQPKNSGTDKSVSTTHNVANNTNNSNGSTNTTNSTSTSTNTVNSTQPVNGGKLPKTATSYPTALLIGASLMLAGVGILTVKPLIGKM